MNPPGERSPSIDTHAISANAPRHPVTVVGGGVIGAACASYLAEAGCDVVLIDRAQFASGCSHGNCGYVSPSHVLPLCRPGVIRPLLRTLLHRNSPVQVSAPFDPFLWAWMWRFLRRCNAQDMVRAGYARQALLNSSRALYDDLFSRGLLDDCEWQTQGLLLINRSVEQFEHNAEAHRLLETEFHVRARRLSEAELLELEPTVRPGVAGAWLFDCDAHLRPDKLMLAWRRRLTAQGVVVREDCEFIGFEPGGRTVSAIRTSAGRLEVDQVIIATGAWTRLLRRQLHATIPIEPGKGYSLTTGRPDPCPTRPMVFEERRVAVTPMTTGFRVGSTMEFAGFDPALRPHRLQLLRDGVAEYLNIPMPEPALESWWGWRPMSCDGLPMIGRVPRYQNVWIAAGHSMVGISMAPATGKLIAELVCDETPHVDPHPFRVDRF